ncbi:RNA methyltransferase substrate-binding domain-containing protein, partial [Acinetobacter baumannii]
MEEIYFEANRRDRRMQDFLKAAEAAGVRLIPADTDRLRGIAG